mmetsp:Transcript_3397/g.8538  ORF Transcript_3397/g.8538 Transcript_3397/m.8538 type:complete len:440 (+) Transcript_3397:1022-2341(+)
MELRADAAVGCGEGGGRREHAAAAAQVVPQHLLLRRAHARDQRDLVHLLFHLGAAGAARLRHGGPRGGRAPSVHALVGDRVAATPRHHVDDGLLAQQLPLHDHLRDVRERDEHPQAGRLARGAARPRGLDDVDSHAEARRAGLALLRPAEGDQEPRRLPARAVHRLLPRRRGHLRLPRRHLVGLHRLLLRAGADLLDLLALARRGIQPAASARGAAARPAAQVGGDRDGARRQAEQEEAEQEGAGEAQAGRQVFSRRRRLGGHRQPRRQRRGGGGVAQVVARAAAALAVHRPPRQRDHLPLHPPGEPLLDRPALRRHHDGALGDAQHTVGRLDRADASSLPRAGAHVLVSGQPGAQLARAEAREAGEAADEQQAAPGGAARHSLFPPVALVPRVHVLVLRHAARLCEPRGIPPHGEMARGVHRPPLAACEQAVYTLYCA